MSSFEAAEAALDQHLSPSSSGADAPQSSQESSQQSADPSSSPDGQQTVAEIMELEKLEKFKFEGREWTPKDLKSAYMMQQDYSRKTAEIAQERKFSENLEADLESVRKNPALAQQFKELYPPGYHKHLKFVLPETPAKAESQSVELPAEVRAQLKELTDFKTNFETKALETEIDSAFSKLTDKYPMADERVVTASANLAIQQGIALRNAEGKVNVEELEKIFKAEHERTQKAFETHYKKQFEQQKAASAKSRDVAGGGGVPGQAPEKLSFEQATEKAIKEMSARH